MICFKCGTQGHKADVCPHDHSEEKDSAENIATSTDKPVKPEEKSTYGSWMIVRKPPRWKAARQPKQTHQQVRSGRWFSGSSSAQATVCSNGGLRRDTSSPGIPPDKSTCPGGHTGGSNEGQPLHFEGAGSRDFKNVLKEDVLQLHILEAHEQFVTAETFPEANKSWFFTAIHANPYLSTREELWDKLETRASRINRPWPLARDFNGTRTFDARDPGGPDMTRRCSKFNNWILGQSILGFEVSPRKHEKALDWIKLCAIWSGDSNFRRVGSSIWSVTNLIMR
ncbi:hypothetical protein Cgig2_023871 [Carnegiea gigantea]|uniref:CCHC-type domain-containing protein n=1 Tax=Carnegiea gigantea TaxID=171969 RepID=A0A9Q1GKJ6_9CARY|nr:hypothetical protein Cgig2_023871 [Carnegiea gigantea]